MRPERPSRHRSPPCGRRSPDRSSEKFACSIAEVTDPLALKVPSGVESAGHNSIRRHFGAGRDPAERNCCAQGAALNCARAADPAPKIDHNPHRGRLISRIGRCLGEVRKKPRTCKKHWRGLLPSFFPSWRWRDVPVVAGSRPLIRVRPQAPTPAGVIRDPRRQPTYAVCAPCPRSSVKPRCVR